MLIDSFYYILSKESSEGNIQAEISLNKDHPILKGHFPGIPIVPGVCMIQIVREILEQEIKQSLQLSSADNIKFLSVINPEENDKIALTLNFNLHEKGYNTQASLFHGPVTYFKFKGLFTIS